MPSSVRALQSILRAFALNCISTTGAWSKTGSMNAARVGHSSTLLQSEKVLNAAGSDAANELNSAETYQP